MLQINNHACAHAHAHTHTITQVLISKWEKKRQEEGTLTARSVATFCSSRLRATGDRLSSTRITAGMRVSVPRQSHRVRDSWWSWWWSQVMGLVMVMIMIAGYGTPVVMAMIGGWGTPGDDDRRLRDSWWWWWRVKGLVMVMLMVIMWSGLVMIILVMVWYSASRLAGCDNTYTTRISYFSVNHSNQWYKRCLSAGTRS